MNQYFFRFLVVIFSVCFLYPLTVSCQSPYDSILIKKAGKLYQKAEEYRAQSNPDSASYYYEKSIDAYAVAKNWQETFAKEIRYANLLGRLGKNQKIIERLSEKLKLSDSLNLDTLRLSNMLLERIAIAYDRSGRHTMAYDCLQKFLKYCKHSIQRDSIYRDYVGKTYNNLAVSLMQSSRYELADIYFDSAILELDKQGLRNSEIEHVIYLNKGNVNRQLGYYPEADRYYQKSLTMLNVNGMSEVDKGLAWWYYANFFLDKNESSEDLHKAIQYNDTAWSYMKNTPALTLYCLYQRGRAYGKLGKYEAGLTDLNEAVNIILERYGENYFELGDTYTMIADIYLMMDSSQLAINYLEKAIAVFDSSYQENPEDKALALISMGNCHFRNKDYNKALEFYQNSIALVNPGFEPKSFADNPDTENLVKSVAIYEALKQKTFVLKAQFEESGDFRYLKAELACYEIMIETVNLSKKDLIELESKISYNEKGYDIYRSAALSAMNAYQISGDRLYLEKAFQYCYRSKASELTEKILYANHRNNESESHNKHLLEINDLKTAVGNLKKEIAFTSDSVRRERLKEDLFSNNEKLRALSDSVKLNNSKINRITHDYTAFTTFSDQLNKQKSLLIEYMEFDNQLMIFTLGEKLNAILIPFNQNVRDSIVLYKVAMENRQFDPRLSHYVYEQLIGPVFDNNTKKYTGLQLIPDGLATMISFESLVTSIPKDGSSPRYLLEDFNITYNYSSLLNNLNKDSDNFEFNFVGFSPDYRDFPGNALATRGIPTDSRLPPLPSAQKEVAMIASLFDGKHLNGSEATETNFRSLAQNTKYLHLAAHALSNNENPLLSRVVLNASRESEDDGAIFAYEIYNMNLNSDLVVLSACNTGTGKYQKGAGVISLASSFKYAGSKNLITSLWSVPDQPTSVIMNSFYHYLNEGNTKADALRKAKLDYLKNADATTANPYYWSGFILIGDPEEEPANQFIWWIITGIAFLTLLAYFKFKK